MPARGFTPFVLGVALTLPLVAVIKDGRDATNPSTTAGPATVKVALGEMFVRPASATTSVGALLEVSNDGATAHTLAVKGSDKVTAELAPGATAQLSLGGLAAGTYELICTVAGHEASGMRTPFTLEAPAAAPHAAPTGHSASGSGPIDFEAMDALMAGPTKAFPAKTKGLGAQALAPTVGADGVKEFVLTASAIDWEVAPGKVVQAMAYNGQVPGPTLAVAVGDRVRVRLRNELPVSTSIHFHGVRTPIAMDGVPDITQAPVKPGTEFVYSFTADRIAVGMYHSHHDAVKQVPDGLAGTFLVGEMPRPAGVRVTQTIPMVLNDAGAIGLTLNGKSFPATAPVSVRPGEWIEVHYLNEGAQLHPMHLHGLDQLVIAKDGFPLPSPHFEDTVTVAPGERWTVLVRASATGVWAWHCHILSHAENERGMFGMVTAVIVK